MGPYSSPYITPNTRLHNPFPPFLTKNQTVKLITGHEQYRITCAIRNVTASAASTYIHARRDSMPVQPRLGKQPSEQLAVRLNITLNPKPFLISIKAMQYNDFEYSRASATASAAEFKEPRKEPHNTPNPKGLRTQVKVVLFRLLWDLYQISKRVTTGYEHRGLNN